MSQSSSPSISPTNVGAPRPRGPASYATSTHTVDTHDKSGSSLTLSSEGMVRSGSLAGGAQLPAIPAGTGAPFDPHALALMPLQPSAQSSRAQLLADPAQALPIFGARASAPLPLTPLTAPAPSAWRQMWHRHHTPALVFKEAATREKIDWLSAVFATGTGGGKLVAAVGAGSLGLFAGDHSTPEAAAGSALMTFGAIVAVAAALVAFGPYVKRNYPDNAIILKTVSISAAGLMIGGNVAAGYAGTQKNASLKIFGCFVYAMGNAAMAISFRNFVAISELERGRLYLQWRRSSSWAMLAAGWTSLFTINVLHESPEYPRIARAIALVVAGAVLCAGLAWPDTPRTRRLTHGYGNYTRQGLCALGIGATLGLSAGNPSLPVDSHLKGVALTLCASPLFGALAVDESERLRVEIQAQAGLLAQP